MFTEYFIGSSDFRRVIHFVGRAAKPGLAVSGQKPYVVSGDDRLGRDRRARRPVRVPVHGGRFESYAPFRRFRWDPVSSFRHGRPLVRRRVHRQSFHSRPDPGSHFRGRTAAPSFFARFTRRQGNRREPAHDYTAGYAITPWRVVWKLKNILNLFDSV